MFYMFGDLIARSCEPVTGLLNRMVLQCAELGLEDVPPASGGHGFA